MDRSMDVGPPGGPTVKRVIISNDAAAVRMSVNDLREELLEELTEQTRLLRRNVELLVELVGRVERQG